MVVVFGDLIADLSMRIRDFPIQAQDLKPISYLEIGPGGAANIAIMASRFGLRVACLGEMGRDTFGEIVMRGLQREGIEAEDVIVTAKTRTPVAGVLVDEQREPAYLGYMGNLVVKELDDNWREAFNNAEALFADGWVEIPEMPGMILDAFRTVKGAGGKIFFDPGPGNPAFDLGWHTEAAALATVLLVNTEEASRLAKIDEPIAAARALVQKGPELLVLKQGAAGMTLLTRSDQVHVKGFPVAARDLTGAGDSVTGAILYGVLKGLDLAALGILGNATGASKVQKLGTGHNMPTLDEIRATLRRFAPERARMI